MLSATGLAFGAPVAHTAPRNSLYLNVGQLGWAAPWMVRWLHHRPDIRPVFMLHDVIPIEYPQLVSRLGHVTHKQMVDTAARHAAGLIFTTDAASQSVLAALHARGRAPPPVVALPLPVAPLFLQPEPPDPGLAAHVYFVLCGAIEPRKNHLLLLRVWQELVRRLGAAYPEAGRGGVTRARRQADPAAAWREAAHAPAHHHRHRPVQPGTASAHGAGPGGY